MGRDKSQLPLGARSMIEHVIAVATEAGLSCRVIDHDSVSSRGPLSGIFTGLETSVCSSVLFLACDMPLIRPDFLREFSVTAQGEDAVFVKMNGKVGFPLALRKTLLPVVSEQLQAAKLSLQDLARDTQAKIFSIGPEREAEFTNINTVEDWKAAGRKFT